MTRRITGIVQMSRLMMNAAIYVGLSTRCGPIGNKTVAGRRSAPPLSVLQEAVAS
jgi:hypothetical protein